MSRFRNGACIDCGSAKCECDEVPDWLRARDERVAQARREANRRAAPLLSYMQNRDDKPCSFEETAKNAQAIVNMLKEKNDGEP